MAITQKPLFSFFLCHYRFDFLSCCTWHISFHLERVRKQKQIDNIKCVQSAVRNNEEYRARTGHNFEVRNCLQEVNEGLV